jgi:hypothetical protein
LALNVTMQVTPLALAQPVQEEKVLPPAVVAGAVSVTDAPAL